MFSFKGKKYSNAKEIADAFNVSLKKFRWRLQEGWSLEEALELKNRVNPRGKGFTVKGQFFATRRDAAKHFGMKEATLNKRIAEGWTLEEALGLSPRESQRNGNPKPCVFLGHKFPSKQARNEFYGLTGSKPSLVEKRIARGWTKRQAVGLDPPPPRNRSKSGKERKHSWRDVEIIGGKYYPKAGVGDYKVYAITNLINGKQYVGVTVTSIDARWRGHCSEALRDVTDTKLSRAIRKYGKKGFKIELLRNDAKNFMELELQEIEEIKKRATIKSGYNISKGGHLASAKPITVGGKLFASQASAAEAFGIDPGVFNLRLAVGKSPEQAAGLLPRADYENIEIKTDKGVWPTLRAACHALNLKYTTVWRRIRKGGWTIEQALNLASPPKPHQMTQPISVNGLNFESQAAFARHIGAHTSVVNKLLKTKSAEEIFAKYQKSNNGK